MAVYATPHETLDGRAMKEHFRHLRGIDPKAPKIHLIVDRGPDHISRETQKAAVTHHRVLHYLPPYSPNLHPIERCWKIMNEQVSNNRFFVSAKAFREAMMHFFKTNWLDIAASVTDRVNDHFQQLQPTPSL